MHEETNKQTNFSPGRPFPSRPLRTDKGPPRAGKLHLPGPGTEEVSLNQTSERARCLRKPTPQEALPKTPLDYSLKLDDGIEAALKAPFLEPQPLIDKFAAGRPLGRRRRALGGRRGRSHPEWFGPKQIEAVRF